MSRIVVDILPCTDTDYLAFLIKSQRDSALDYRSKGQVVTEDGRTVDFELNLYNSRSYYEKSEISAEVSGTFHDPLVINLDGEGIDFGDKTLRIDLDLDGQVDAVKWLKNGSGFLALDKNANGTVDDGSELFGPESGNGFGELNAYDGDANGVIDENDAVFNRLKVWTPRATPHLSASKKPVSAPSS
ncbi:hypothetical protein ACR6HW_09540 [Fusibacter sp. JL298sf-3]